MDSISTVLYTINMTTFRLYEQWEEGFGDSDHAQIVDVIDQLKLTHCGQVNVSNKVQTSIIDNSPQT